MELLTRLSLASDAAIMALIGTLFLILAGIASLMEFRRNRLRGVERLEKVGWVPWTGIFVGCMIIGGGLIAMSLPVVIGNL